MENKQEELSEQSKAFIQKMDGILSGIENNKEQAGFNISMRYSDIPADKSIMDK